MYAHIFSFIGPGNESYAIVEYAPYQKIPGEKKKPDSRHATIEKGLVHVYLTWDCPESSAQMRITFHSLNH